MNAWARLVAVMVALGAVVCPSGSAQAASMLIVPATASTPALPMYVVRPPGNGPFPAVLVLHGCEGFNGFIAVAADRLAARGYVVAALDTLTPNHVPPCTNVDATPVTTTDARVALAWLRTLPHVAPDELGVMGFSMGGGAALNLVDPPVGSSLPPPGLRAVVAFYPDCNGHPGNNAVPVAIFNGSADVVTPAPVCAKLAAAAASAGKTLVLSTYPSATHGFLIPGPDRDFFGTTVRYDPIATADSAIKTERFFAQYLRAP